MIHGFSHVVPNKNQRRCFVFNDFCSFAVQCVFFEIYDVNNPGMTLPPY